MKRIIAIAMIAISLALAGCRSPIHNPCRHHGGERTMIGGIYYCRDGSEV